MTPEQLSKFLSKVQVKSVEECAAKCDFHLCSDHATGLKGEKESVCSDCGKPVFYSQEFPASGRIPPRICIKCALIRGKAEKAGEQSFDA